MNKRCELKMIFKVITVIVTVLLLVFVFYGLRLGIFRNKMILVDYIKKFGIIAPIFFIFFQSFQVVFPVIPGGASCLAGVLAFGELFGFVYNYIGLVLGSIISFSLSRKYGIKIIKKFFKQETIDKYLGYIKTNKFNRIFFWGIFLPGLPDDLLCYIAGISEMNFKTFLMIILVGKPLALFMYSCFVIFI